MEQYITLEKAVGETPLDCLEAFRAHRPDLADVPMAYAGRLDPMASGKLLVLIGEECKKQTEYHNLDKEYEFSVLLGIGSDTHDVLGRLDWTQGASDSERVKLGLAALSALEESLRTVSQSLVGEITLPYPHFSSKTVAGKPLHTWTLEGKLNEIDIPTKISTIYELEPFHIEKVEREEMCHSALSKIDTIPPVTDARKALGNDFRRTDVRADWHAILADKNLPSTYRIAHFRCVASSGTYMRTLTKVIAERIGTVGLAWHIHRTKIGRFTPAEGWTKEF